MLCTTSIYSYILFAANIEDFKSIAKKIITEKFADKIIKLSSDSHFETDPAGENNHENKFDNRKKDIPKNARSGKSQNFGTKIDFEELVNKVRERLETEYRNKYRNSIGNKTQSNVQHSTLNSEHETSFNNKHNITIRHSVENLEETQDYKEHKNVKPIKVYTEPDPNTYDETVTDADTIVYETEITYPTKRIEINVAGNYNNNYNNTTVEKESIYVKNDDDEDTPYKKIQIAKIDSYEDYVTPEKEQNIFASDEGIAQEDNIKNERINYESTGKSKYVKYTEGTTRRFHHIPQSKTTRKTRFKTVSPDRFNDFGRNHKSQVFETTKWHDFVQKKSTKKSIFKNTVPINYERYNTLEFKTTKKMIDIIQNQDTESGRFKMKHNNDKRGHRDYSTDRGENNFDRHQEYRTTDGLPYSDTIKSKIKITYNENIHSEMDRDPLSAMDPPDYNEAGTNEIKAKTDTLWFDDSEPIPKDTKILSEERHRSGTGVPTRLTYKMVSPNYYASLPTIAERYDFNEPLPERDRDREHVKYIGCILLLIATSVVAHPLTDSIESMELDTDISLENNLPVVSYAQNFKNTMAAYVKKQYQNLTDEQMDSIRKILEKFLHNFASDIRDIIVNGFYETEGELDDGIPDSTFDEIRNSIRNEMRSISDLTADHIIYRLRKNLSETLSLCRKCCTSEMSSCITMKCAVE
ncbi:unnamed protein product [Leptidea sinapis]|uniref:Uncharacterized protein n=1 Tax=Leptidea sinapis TaxID=189913 RepID=A0A5E4PZ60_9NEOP|nr:unnamed protein product [Leptidea sinapis]